MRRVSKQSTANMWYETNISPEEEKSETPRRISSKIKLIWRKEEYPSILKMNKKQLNHSEMHK